MSLGGVHTKKREVVRLLGNLVLESEKSVEALAVHDSHIDIEDAEETICSVFHPRRLAGRDPRHPSANSNSRQQFTVQEHLYVNPRDAGYLMSQDSLVPSETTNTYR